MHAVLLQQPVWSFAIWLCPTDCCWMLRQIHLHLETKIMSAASRNRNPEQAVSLQGLLTEPSPALVHSVKSFWRQRCLDLYCLAAFALQYFNTTFSAWLSSAVFLQAAPASIHTQTRSLPLDGFIYNNKMHLPRKIRLSSHLSYRNSCEARKKCCETQNHCLDKCLLSMWVLNKTPYLEPCNGNHLASGKYLSAHFTACVHG